MGTIRYQRVADFMKLFTKEETENWSNHQAPDWVVEGIVWFMDQDPAHRELMERLAEDD